MSGDLDFAIGISSQLAGNDRIVETPDFDQDRVAAAVDYALGFGVRVEQMRTTSSAGTTTIALTGNELSQTIFGNAGAKRLDGKGGWDTMNEGAGADAFVFSTRPGMNNLDRIRDYSVADARIELDSGVFAALSPGAILPGNFRVNPTGQAVDASDRIIYNTTNGYPC